MDKRSPLGFDFDSADRLIVADPLYGAHGGLLRVSGRGVSATVEVLVDAINGEPLRYVDAVIVAINGRIYFSDASARFGPKAFEGTFNASVLDILEHRNTGRVLEFDPATRRTRVIMHGLSFANGVALSADEQFLCVAETGEYRLWCGFTKPRAPFADRTASMPWLRALALRLPRAMWPVPPAPAFACTLSPAITVLK